MVFILGGASRGMLRVCHHGVARNRGVAHDPTNYACAVHCSIARVAACAQRPLAVEPVIPARAALVTRRPQNRAPRRTVGQTMMAQQSLTGSSCLSRFNLLAATPMAWRQTSWHSLLSLLRCSVRRASTDDLFGPLADRLQSVSEQARAQQRVRSCCLCEHPLGESRSVC